MDDFLDKLAVLIRDYEEHSGEQLSVLVESEVTTDEWYWDGETMRENI